MASSGTDYLDICLVAILWGITNPYIRKGTVEEDEKKILLEQQQQQYQESHQNEGLSPDAMESAHSYQVMHMDGDNRLQQKHDDISSSSSSPHQTQYKIFDESQQKIIQSQGQELHSFSIDTPNQSQPTSYTKGVILKLLSKLLSFNPRALSKSFLKSIAYELSKFTNPNIAIPFFFNQCSAIFYFRLIATSDLTNVAYCSSLSMAIEGIVSYFLGERMNNPIRGFCGALIVMIGVSICLLSKNIENYLNGNDGTDDYVGGENNGERILLSSFSSLNEFWEGQNESNHHRLFEISPFLGWFALCGIVNGILQVS